MRPRGGATALFLILFTTAGGCAARRPQAAAPDAPPEGALATPGPPAAASEAPVVRDIVLEGIAAFPPAAVYRAIVLRPGGRLRREAATYAADLERRYQAHGYLGARVSAAWDAERGVLTLRADEGRLRELDLTGIEGGAETQARTLLALKSGEVLTEKDLRAGLRRLEDGSGGAFRLAGEPPYTVDPLSEGVRLKVAVARVPVKLRVRIQGPDLSPLNNRVEGLAPGAGVELTVFDQTALAHSRVYARGAYGFKSHDPRFALGAQRPFAGQRLVLGYEFHDLTDTDDAFRKYPVELTPGVVRVFSITEDYFRRRGHEAYAFLRPSPRLHLGLSYRRDRFESLPVLARDSVFFFKRTARLNPEVDEGPRNAVLFTARWAAGAPLYATPVAERDSFLMREPYGDRLRRDQSARVDASFEIGGRAGDGGASYRRFIGHLHGRRDLATLFAVDGRLLLGLGSDLPPQRRFALGGAGTLRGYGLKTLSGNDAVLGTVEGRLHPAARGPDLIAFYDGGAAWTRGTEGAGYRDDVGVGLEWPGGGEGRVRVDGAYALRPLPGQRRARVHASVVLPF
ncbi:MAG TPA: POTRA domain-containing protein [Vicinamibacteria bacterium]